MQKLKLGQSVKKIIDLINKNFTEIFTKPFGLYKTLYEGKTIIPSQSSGNSTIVYLTDDIGKYDGIVIQREDTGTWQYFGPLTINTILKPVNSQADFSMMEGLNLFECNCEILNNRQLKFSHNVYGGIKSSGGARYITSFEEVPITKIIGVKINK